MENFAVVIFHLTDLATHLAEEQSLYLNAG